jgi:transcriptional regulator with XRE-family HTH domain
MSNNKRVYKTRCKHGHVYNPENTGYRRDSKARFCRTCQNEWCLRYRLRKLQEQQLSLQVTSTQQPTKSKINAEQAHQIREVYQQYQELMLKQATNAVSGDSNAYDANNVIELAPITMERLAIAYGVSRNTISLILRNLTHHDPNYDPNAHVIKLLGQTVAVKSGAKGERSGTAKLTKIKVRNIRQALASGDKSGAELAREYRVSRMTISDIKHGKRWKSVIVTNSSNANI